MTARSESPNRSATNEHKTVLWTDGAARGNPGAAGICAVLKSSSGELL
jgi:hypothetical protein